MDIEPNFPLSSQKNFLHFFRHGDWFYNRYINTSDKNLDDDGSGVKPNHALQIRMKCISFGDSLQAMFDRDRKMAKDNFGRKRKATGCIFLPGSDFREAEGHLSMRSCLQDAVINSDARVGKYINKLGLYRQLYIRR